MPLTEDRRRSVAALTLAVLAFAVLPGPPAAQAHGGYGCGFDLLRLEGECYSSPAGCDPDEQDEHVHVEPWPLASDGATAFLPRTDCGIVFGTLVTPDAGSFAGVGVRCSGTGVAMTVALRVNVDFAHYGSLTFVCNAPSSVVHVPWLGAPRLSAGTHHQLEVHATILTGPVFANVEIDYLDYLPALPA